MNMTLKDKIIDNWNSFDERDCLCEIKDLSDDGYPAWTLKESDGKYGVAIEYNGTDKIKENFAGVIMSDGETDGGMRVIKLVTNSESGKELFASLCETFVNPGNDGELREEIRTNPLPWWKEWKELLGNRNIEERVYDVLGELCAFMYTLENGDSPVWNGPERASYDIECADRFIEVKSSIVKNKREITVSNIYQFDNPCGKPLNLVFCLFEPTAHSGVTIDGLVEEIKEYGYNGNLLNEKLELCGLEEGMSARRKPFILHEMLLYKIDENFPRITDELFVEKTLPKGIIKITYTVDLHTVDALQLPLPFKNGTIM